MALALSVRIRPSRCVVRVDSALLYLWAAVASFGAYFPFPATLKRVMEVVMGNALRQERDHGLIWRQRHGSIWSYSDPREIAAPQKAGST